MNVIYKQLCLYSWKTYFPASLLFNTPCYLRHDQAASSHSKSLLIGRGKQYHPVDLQWCRCMESIRTFHNITNLMEIYHCKVVRVALNNPGNSWNRLESFQITVNIFYFPWWCLQISEHCRLPLWKLFFWTSPSRIFRIYQHGNNISSFPAEFRSLALKELEAGSYKQCLAMEQSTPLIVQNKCFDGRRCIEKM